ncbi:MAG: virulence RhuM family protein [Oscillospiraceae bacterium]|nr:virulence RhuM family protein [Oscillospiraceae bacterium]
MDKNEIILYETEDHAVKLNVNTDGETVWLNRAQLAELFDRDIKTIGKHISNALKEELVGDTATVAKFATVQTEGELDRDSVVANFATTATDGKTYQVDCYNLDVIISVGYRVKSQRGVEFRKWANSVLP